MFDWLFGKTGDGLTCPERMLKLMKDGDWVSTETLYEHIKDYKDAKCKLKKQGYLFDRKYEGKNVAGKQKKGTNYKTYYRLIGQIPAFISPRGKRGYMKDFTTEELVSELWARGNIGTMVANSNVYHILSNYDDNSLTPPCLCNNSCS